MIFRKQRVSNRIRLVQAQNGCMSFAPRPICLVHDSFSLKAPMPFMNLLKGIPASLIQVSICKTPHLSLQDECPSGTCKII